MADGVGVEPRTALKCRRDLPEQVTGIREGRCQHLLIALARGLHWRIHRAIVTPHAPKRQSEMRRFVEAPQRDHRSRPIITSVDLMIATASSPFFSFNSFTASRVITAVRI